MSKIIYHFFWCSCVKSQPYFPFLQSLANFISNTELEQLWYVTSYGTNIEGTKMVITFYPPYSEAVHWLGRLIVNLVTGTVTIEDRPMEPYQSYWNKIKDMLFCEGYENLAKEVVPIQWSKSHLQYCPDEIQKVKLAHRLQTFITDLVTPDN